jgi:hypothetical protein
MQPSSQRAILGIVKRFICFISLPLSKNIYNVCYRVRYPLEMVDFARPYFAGIVLS